jgi:hypothetical protein
MVSVKSKVTRREFLKRFGVIAAVGIAFPPLIRFIPEDIYTVSFEFKGRFNETVVVIPARVKKTTSNFITWEGFFKCCKSAEKLCGVSVWIAGVAITNRDFKMGGYCLVNGDSFHLDYTLEFVKETS